MSPQRASMSSSCGSSSGATRAAIPWWTAPARQALARGPRARMVSAVLAELAGVAFGHRPSSQAGARCAGRDWPGPPAPRAGRRAIRIGGRLRAGRCGTMGRGAHGDPCMGEARVGNLAYAGADLSHVTSDASRCDLRAMRLPVRRAEPAVSRACGVAALPVGGGVAERSMAADCKSADFASTKVRILPPPPVGPCAARESASVQGGAGVAQW